jgi:hypothetical protein
MTSGPRWKGSMVSSSFTQVDLQDFVNIHFRAPEFGQWMLVNDRAAMLHFIYNPKVVSVLVCHDI